MSDQWQATLHSVQQCETQTFDSPLALLEWLEQHTLTRSATTTDLP